MTGAEAEALAAALVEKGYVGIVLDRLAKQASEVLGTERSSILVRDREDRRLTIVAASNGFDDELVGSHVPRRAERLESTVDAAVRFRWSGAVRGALSVRSTIPTRRFTVGELDVLTTLGAITGAAVRHMVRRGTGVILAFGGSGPQTVPGIGGFKVALDAVEGHRRQWALELGAQGIRVVTLKTGGIPESVPADTSPEPVSADGPPPPVFVLPVVY